jgi:hypothetical protein
MWSDEHYDDVMITMALVMFNDADWIPEQMITHKGITNRHT